MLRDMAYSALPIYYKNALSKAPEMYSQLGGSFQYIVDEDGTVMPKAMVESASESLSPEIGPDALPDASAVLEGPNRVFAQVPYNLVWQGTALASIFNTNSYDQETDLIEYLSIQEAGSGDMRTFAEDTAIARFTDPTTGATYEAAQSLDGLSITYDLLTFAKNYKEGPWQRSYDIWQDNQDNPDYLSQFNNRDYYLQQFVELMNDLRLIRSLVDVAR